MVDDPERNVSKEELQGLFRSKMEKIKRPSSEMDWVGK